MCYHAGMETLMIASDLHGDGDALHRLGRWYEELGASRLLLLGDLGLSSLDPDDLLRTSPVLVKGNCDNPYDFSAVGRPLPPLVRRLSWEGRTVAMTHGDRWPSPYGLDLHAGDVFCFGHLHQSRLYRNDDGIIILNPGSTSYPRGGEPASFAIARPDAICVVRLHDGAIIRQMPLEAQSLR